MLNGKHIGYGWLARRFGVSVMPHWVEFRAVSGGRRSETRDGRQIEFVPTSQDPGDGIFEHLEFGLRREGLHLELLRKVLPRLDAGEVAAWVKSRPTGRYARVIWFLYEIFAGQPLDLPDLKTGNYVDLLDPETYLIGPVRKARRQRINVNLLGTVHFAPVVRREGVEEGDETTLRDRCAEILGDYPPEIYKRALRYLYSKESKSSYEVERETPTQKRAEVFIRLLEQAWDRDFLTKEALVELQKAVVDSRYANQGWRSGVGEQIYVGETLAPGLERVHFAGPKPEDLDELMAGFLDSARLLTEAGETVPALPAAAVVSFVFDFLHPFSDGNGRIHRFLLHHILARRRLGPQGIILPVSAVILNRPRDYDRALESFSKPLMERAKYEMDDRQRMTVTNETADFYRYIDCTEIVRIAIGFIRQSIEEELPTELNYLEKYDEIRRRMSEIVELPNRVADLFILLCRQNGGKLSARKRKLPEFAPLTDAEIQKMEGLVS